MSATVAPGVCWLIYAYLVQQYDPRYYDPVLPIDYLAIAVYSAGLVLLAPAGMALHMLQAARAGLDERIGVWVVGIGAVVAGVGDFAEDGLGISMPGSGLWFSGMLTLLLGLLLFGIGTMRARVLPLWCGGLLIVSPVVGTLLGGLFSNWRGTALFGLTWVALGFTLLFHHHRVSRPQS